MSTRTYVRRTRLAATAEEVFAWHARPGALERLTPPWISMRIAERSGDGLDVGTRVVLEVKLAPLPVTQRWVAEHTALEPGRMFRDEMKKGPFSRWVHTHRFEPEPDGGCTLEDHVEYALPLGGGGPLGHLVARRELDRMFAYRHRVTASDLAAHRALAGGAAAGGRAIGARPLRVLVTGASGLVGAALVPFLTTGGHEVARLARGKPGKAGRGSAGGGPRWDPARGLVDAAALEGYDAVVHLAGESIASGRWSAARKRRIRDSRRRGTLLLTEALSRLERKPEVLVSASAIGIYGDRGDELLTEASPPGEGFLADVCRDWEAATEPAEEAGIRVVKLRTGIVLSPRGGALAVMLPPFELGLGGPIGSGRQWQPWISIEDEVEAIHRAILDRTLAGPVNAVAPGAVRQKDFARALGRVLRRPALAPLPGFAARAVLGEMAEELLLSSAHVEPAKLVSAGHAFRHRELEPALRHLLGR